MPEHKVYKQNKIQYNVIKWGKERDGPHQSEKYLYIIGITLFCNL